MCAYFLKELSQVSEFFSLTLLRRKQVNGGVIYDLGVILQSSKIIFTKLQSCIHEIYMCSLYWRHLWITACNAQMLQRWCYVVCWL